MQKIRIKIFLLAILTIAFFCIALTSAVSFSGSWLLKAADTPGKSDAIIILSGSPLRAFYAADLYRQGFAPKVYISKAKPLPSTMLLKSLNIIIPAEEEINKQVLLKKGVPEKDIAFMGSGSLSSAEEAEELKELFRGKNYHFLIVVSPYQARRTKIIFKDKLKGSQITVVATPYEKTTKEWWTNKYVASEVVLELSKIIFYKTGHSFRSNK